MLLTKSKYLAGLSCPRYLWMMCHERDKVPENSAATTFRMQQGHIIGQIAKKLFPEGIDVREDDFKKNLETTKELLKEKKCIFEAGILSGDLYARADVLVPVEGGWDIIEVKSSTSVKSEHIQDVSFQKHVYEQAGLRIRSCVLMHINREFVRQGDINPQQFLKRVDITQQVQEAEQGIPDRIRALCAIMNASEPMQRCNNGSTCPCWSFLPESHIFELYRGGKTCLELLEAQVLCLKDIPDNVKLSGKQKIQVDCARTGKPYVNKVKIRTFLEQLQGKLHFIDFETYNLGVPPFDGVRPYQQIPFQFSVHTVDGDSVVHHEFLAEDNKDNREEFLIKLKECLGESGKIVVFNQAFESRVLKELAEAFPAYLAWVASLEDRMIDLLIPFRNFDYYHPAQNGSASIKKVLPALTGLGYDTLEIADGDTASLSFLEMVSGLVPPKKTRADLLQYCCLDTWGMVKIVETLKEISG